MHDDVQVYDHPVLSAHARRAIIVLAAVAALVLGLVAPAEAAGGRITGTVTAVGGGPLADVWVEVYTVDDLEYVDSASTNALGEYDVPVPAGSYLLVFWPDGAGYEPELYDDVHDFEVDDATPVPVPEGGTATADAALTPYASISGHVTMTADDPRNTVRVYDADDEVVGWGWVDEDGSYEVSSLSAGDYRIAFNRLSGFAFSAPEFFDDHEEGGGLAGGDVVTLAEGEAKADVDAVLAEGGHLTGTLRDAEGQPLRCRLQAFTTDRTLVTRNGWSDPVTGAFDITGLSTGAYQVRVVNAADCRNGLQYVDTDRGALSTDDGAAAALATTLGADTPVAGAPLVYDLGPAPANVVPPSILGTPTVGTRLSATRGSWNPGDHLTFAYQWLAAGVPIPGATKQDYRVGTADVGKPLTVRVTATRSRGRTASATSAPTAAVTGGALFPRTPPIVHGVAAVDAVLTVDPGNWGVPGATFTYVWMTGAFAPVATTSSPTFKVPDSVWKKSLWLTVVASAPGYASNQTFVPVTPKVLNGSWPAIKAPRLTGKAKVGATLKVHAAKVSPKPRRLTFTWYRDRQVIDGVDVKRYRLTEADVGHRIRVVVTYGKLHYEHPSVATKRTKRVRR